MAFGQNSCHPKVRNFRADASGFELDETAKHDQMNAVEHSPADGTNHSRILYIARLQSNYQERG
jgi:hypothetical protein